MSSRVTEEESSGGRRRPKNRLNRHIRMLNNASTNIRKRATNGASKATRDIAKRTSVEREEDVSGDGAFSLHAGGVSSSERQTQGSCRKVIKRSIVFGKLLESHMKAWVTAERAKARIQSGPPANNGRRRGPQTLGFLLCVGRI